MPKRDIGVVPLGPLIVLAGIDIDAAVREQFAVEVEDRDILKTVRGREGRALVEVEFEVAVETMAPRVFPVPPRFDFKLGRVGNRGLVALGIDHQPELRRYIDDGAVLEFFVVVVHAPGSQSQRQRALLAHCRLGDEAEE